MNSALAAPTLAIQLAPDVGNRWNTLLIYLELGGEYFLIYV